MATITKKPRNNKAKISKSNLSDNEIAQLIAKGGEVPAEVKPETAVAPKPKKKVEKKVSVQLRLPQQLINRIDDILEARVVDVSRHTWFLEAIESKILAEGKISE